MKKIKIQYLLLVPVLVLIVVGAVVLSNAKKQKGDITDMEVSRGAATEEVQRIGDQGGDENGEPGVVEEMKIINNPNDALLSVAVNGYQDKPNDELAEAYVNAYKVTPVNNGEYSGVLLETKQTGANGEGVVFTVQPGEIIDFVGFKKQQHANNAKTWTFKAPPYKNFSGEDGTAERLCQINFLDTQSKLQSNGGDSCVTAKGAVEGGMSIPAVDQDTMISVAVNGYSDKPDDLLPNSYVNMYEITFTQKGAYIGKLLETKSTGNGGEGAVFGVQPGQIVDFIGFNKQDNATKSQAWSFTPPPYKNFSAEDGVLERLCQINFLDTKSKLQSNGADSCVTAKGARGGMSVPASDKDIEALQ